MPSNHTQNYSLSQWEKSDKVLMEDFNSDNLKIDGALAGLAAKDKALEAILAGKGNCQVYTASYSGRGTFGESAPTSLTLPRQPYLVLIVETKYAFAIIPRGCQYFLNYNSGNGSLLSTCTCTWNGNSISWFSGRSAEGQLNDSNRTYNVIAFLPV